MIKPDQYINTGLTYKGFKITRDSIGNEPETYTATKGMLEFNCGQIIGLADLIDECEDITMSNYDGIKSSELIEEWHYIKSCGEKSSVALNNIKKELFNRDFVLTCSTGNWSQYSKGI